MNNENPTPNQAGPTPPLMSIPRMPHLWDKTEVLVNHKTLAGSLACWAIRQSPYIVPENLGPAIAEFMEQWSHEDYARLDTRALHQEIRAVIDRSPLVKAWNEPKKEGAVNTALGCAFVSRYESIHPDWDFIDLGALARNVAHEITLWEQVEAAQDGSREPREPLGS